MAVTVIGREEELGAIQAFLAEVEHGPSALVLSGEPGIGKTILWEAGVEDAAGSFASVLTCRGVEAEASLSFAALSELLRRCSTRWCPRCSRRVGGRSRSRLLLVEPGDQPPDAHAIGLAVLDVLHALAERGPVLVALDDLQWLDPASAGVLQIALRRLREEPVGVLATARRGRRSSPVELERSFPEERLASLPSARSAWAPSTTCSRSGSVSS